MFSEMSMNWITVSYWKRNQRSVENLFGDYESHFPLLGAPPLRKVKSCPVLVRSQVGTKEVTTVAEVKTPLAIIKSKLYSQIEMTKDRKILEQIQDIFNNKKMNGNKKLNSYDHLTQGLDLLP